MKLLLIIASLALTVHAGSTESDKCKIKINGKFVATEVLKNRIDSAFRLNVDADKNELYFSYSASLKDDDNKAAKIDLDTKKYEDIKGVDNGFATAINSKDKEIYIGGSGGIYKIDQKVNDTAIYFGENGSNICNLYYSDALYFSVFPDKFVYTYNSGAKKLEDLTISVDTFIADANYIYYTTDAGLFKLNRKSKETVPLNDLKNKNDVRALVEDRNGNLFLCLQDGIYSVDEEKKTVAKVFHINDAFGLAFDKDNNMVYSDGDRLVRLKPDTSCV